MAIDFDALFAAYARERMTVTDDTPEDEIEEAAYALYHDFLETPLAELDGRTTKEYAAELGTYGLLDEVLECTREGIKPTDHLLDCLLKDEAAAEAALCEVLYDDAITSAEGVFVIDLLMDLESRKPLLRYEEILLNEDADDALADAAAEAVIALNDGETAQEKQGDGKQHQKQKLGFPPAVKHQAKEQKHCIFRPDRCQKIGDQHRRQKIV